MSNRSLHPRHVLMGAALLGALGVGAGAFGAHALRELVPPERVATFETGARYALLHALALMGVGSLGLALPRLWSILIPTVYLWTAGVAIFAGSLWALVLLDLPILGAVTPLGGAALIAGWLVLAWRLRGVQPAD